MGLWPGNTSPYVFDSMGLQQLRLTTGFMCVCVCVTRGYTNAACPFKTFQNCQRLRKLLLWPKASRITWPAWTFLLLYLESYFFSIGEPIGISCDLRKSTKARLWNQSASGKRGTCHPDLHLIFLSGINRHPTCSSAGHSSVFATNFCYSKLTSESSFKLSVI